MKNKLLPQYGFQEVFEKIISENNLKLSGKLIFKTKETNWINTQESTVIPISIHSKFNEGILGFFKMEAFLKVLSDNIKGPITILLAEKAHTNVMSMSYHNNYARALEVCKRDAAELKNRFISLFNQFSVSNWEDYITNDPNRDIFENRIKNLAKNDPIYSKALLADAEEIYTPARKKLRPNKSEFLENTVADLVEMQTGYLVLENKNHKFLFYPGSPSKSWQYVQSKLSQIENNLLWINTVLNLNKKKYIQTL